MDIDVRPFVARSGLSFNAPCDEARAASLVAQVASPRARVVDLGCGWGELLLRVCAACEGGKGDGVESYAPYLERARARRRELGLDGRVTFHEGDARAWTEPADVLISVGSGHLWGETARERASAWSKRVRRGGVLVLGEGFYAREPSAEVLGTIGPLPRERDLHEALEGAGYAVVSVERSSPREWDDFEASWRAPFESEEDEGLRAFARERRRGYEEGYRGTLGFAWVVARDQRTGESAK